MKRVIILFKKLIFYNIKDRKPTELDSLSLDEGSTVRGFVFYRSRFPREEKDKMTHVEYQTRELILPSGPRVFILDSEGFMHHFNYYDTRYSLPSQSMLVEPIKINVMHGIRQVPNILANRSMIIADSFHWEPDVKETNSSQRIQMVQYQVGSEDDPKMKKDTFKYQGCSKSIGNWSNENSHNPYMLGIIKTLYLNSFHNR